MHAEQLRDIAQQALEEINQRKERCMFKVRGTATLPTCMGLVRNLLFQHLD